ncbi:MAG: hypothetical protein LWX08_00310, partial [Deltaproteobacteria bacterium]|nr:hypothetical protein [Deltaproteobacteria bacterium]
MTSKNILVTGPPRCGKSTLIEKVILCIEKPMTGFFTREIKEKGKRVGFSIITLDGKKGVLAHQNIRSRCRVGKYGVNLDDIDRIAVSSIIPMRLTCKTRDIHSQPVVPPGIACNFIHS